MDANEWNDRYAASDSVWGIEPNQFVRAQISASGIPPGRALDLGTGEGRNALWLATLDWDVLGIDFSEAAIDKARETAAEADLSARFEVGDVLTYPLDESGFDLVLIAYIQFAPEERTRLLARATAALAPGGTLLIIAHDVTNLEAGYGGPQSSTVLWSVEDTADYLRDQELQVAVAEVVERHVDTEEGPRTALDTLVRARRRASAS
ncbi:MAG: methyltransferase domain-containing protein [Acidimicrobiales bacterium]